MVKIKKEFSKKTEDSIFLYELFDEINVISIYHNEILQTKIFNNEKVMNYFHEYYSIWEWWKKYLTDENYLKLTKRIINLCKYLESITLIKKVRTKENLNDLFWWSNRWNWIISYMNNKFF